MNLLIKSKNEAFVTNRNGFLTLVNEKGLLKSKPYILTTKTNYFLLY